ncbi:hypothetical protein [Streptomyces sp. NPDC059063]|uniref:hypothetical protein n=1 Tax=unclassified Streptomyces TaxID=2593676 RepID=UPI0036A832E0
MPRPLHVDVLSFDEIVRYFVEERPPVPQVHHGALLTQAGSPSRIPCLQLFVDRANRPCLMPSGAPYGRYVVARQLDVELRNMLAGRKLIIFE